MPTPQPGVALRLHGHRLAQTGSPPTGVYLWLRGSFAAASRPARCVGRREVGLARAEADDVLSGRLQRLRLRVDGERGDSWMPATRRDTRSMTGSSWLGRFIMGQCCFIGSSNALIGLDDAWDVLASGGSAVDAVEIAVRAVEDNPDDHSVGYGGLPNWTASSSSTRRSWTAALAGRSRSGHARLPPRHHGRSRGARASAACVARRRGGQRSASELGLEREDLRPTRRPSDSSGVAGDVPPDMPFARTLSSSSTPDTVRDAAPSTSSLGTRLGNLASG